MARKIKNPGVQKTSTFASEQPILNRDTFAKISEVQGIRLSDEMKQAFAEFDRRRLPAVERRRRHYSSVQAGGELAMS